MDKVPIQNPETIIPPEDKRLDSGKVVSSILVEHVPPTCN